MEEQEKKTRRTASAKNTTSKESATKKTTKKASTSPGANKAKAAKTTSASKNVKKSTVKEEKQPKDTAAKKEKTAIKIEEKPKKVSGTKKNSESKTKASKSAKAKEEKNVSSTKKTTNTKVKSTDIKEKTDKIEVVENPTVTNSSKESKKEKIIENKKTTKEAKNEKEQPKEQKQTKKTNKYIEISIGGIIALLVIGLLLVLNITLGKRAYNMFQEKDNKTNSVVDTNAEIEEIGTVLNHQNEIVNKLIEKITLPLNTTASIYQIGDFDKETIANDLKLRIGWANLEETSKYHAKQATGETTILVEKSAMEEAIKEIFGEQVTYTDSLFDNTDVKAFSECAETQGKIDFDGENYIGVVNENAESGKVAFVYQEVQKVVKYEKEIIILTKTAFIEQQDNKYIVYKKYNKDFKNKLMEITPEELFENSTLDKITGKGTIATANNPVLNDIREELNTYKYTFEKDDSTGEYYLKEFKKENDNV